MKRFLLILLLFGWATASGHAQTSFPQNTLILGDHLLIPQTPPCPTTEAPPLADITPINIRLENAGTLQGVQLHLLYDPDVLEFVDPVGSCLEHMEGKDSFIRERFGESPSAVVRYDYPPSMAGMILFAVASSQFNSGSGTLVTLYARAKPGVAPGSVSSFSVNPDIQRSFLVGDQVPIPPHIQNGSITVGTAGDVDGDWAVNVDDAVGSLRFAVQLVLPTPNQMRAADMNGDRYISVNDTIMVLKKAIGILQP